MRDDQGAWGQPEVTAFTNERALQTLVNESPHLLTGVPQATVDEFWIPGIGSVDLVGVGEAGAVTVVECKLRANPEIRREVVGQVLAYAGGLWQMSYDDFASTWRQRSSRELHEPVAEKVGKDVDPDALRQAVTGHLANGDFTLVIAVDDITEELKRVVEFLNAATRVDVTVLALELQYVRDGSKEILIPRTYGEALRETKNRAATAGSKWNAETFGAALAALADTKRTVVEKLLKHGEEHGAYPWWGVGQVPGMSYYYRVGQQPVSLFQVYLRPAGPVVAVSLGAVSSAKSMGPGVARRLLKLLQKIEALQPVLGHLTERDLNRYPSIPVVGTLDQEGVVAAFLAAMDTVREAGATRQDAQPPSEG